MNPESMLQYPYAEPPPAGGVVQAAPGVGWLRMPLPFALNHINLWLLDDGEGVAVVDCGIGNEATRALWEKVIADYLAGRRITRVILTHHHPDHAGNAQWLRARYGAEFWIAQGEYLACHAVREGYAGYSQDGLLAMYRANGLSPEHDAKMQQRGSYFRVHVPEFPDRYGRLMEGKVLSIGGREWRVVMGYGHSPEHAALYCESLGVLISGDMVLPRITTNVSVPTIEPEGNPLALFLASTRNYARLPADTLVLPSHGLPFRGLRERAAYLEEHHRERLADVEGACDAPRSAADIVPILFRRELDAHQMFFAMGESMAHLHWLHAEGRLLRKPGADGIVRFVRP